MIEDKAKLVSSLLISIAGIMIFLALAHFISLNGIGRYSPFLILLGIFMLFWPQFILRHIKPLTFIHKPLILTVSHILIFIGGKIYLDRFIENWWVSYIVIGIILLNYSEPISKKLLEWR